MPTEKVSMRKIKEILKLNYKTDIEQLTIRK